MAEEGVNRPDLGSGGTSHVTLMDRVYRHQRHIYDLTRKCYLLGRDRLIRGLEAKTGESVVEIGCGTARNLIRIARANPGVRLYGLDASHEMLRTAAEAIRRAGLSDRIVLAHGLAEEMTPALFGLSAPFDHAVFSYSLSMIPDWRSALATAARAVREDGTVDIVDFGDLAALWPPAARGLRAWLRLFHVAPRDKLLKLLETMPPDGDLRLHILPGRYAFVLKADPASILALNPRPVAA
jgi:S-adenosylmethionine-diacylgycerolhomoserine-N-methlytransferase